MMIIATPIFMNRLGPEQYGLWMLMTVVVQVMNALNFGVGESTIREVAQQTATNASIPIQETFTRNFSLSLLLLMASVTLGTLGALLIQHFHLFNIPVNDRKLALWMLVLFSCSAGFKLIEQVFLSMFKGIQRFDISARLTILSRLSVLIGSIVIVYLGYSLIAIVLVTVILNMLNLLLQALTLRSVMGIKNFKPKFSLLRNKTLLDTNMWYWFQSVIALLGYLSDRILIGQVTDMKTVGYYSIAVLIGIQIHNALLAFGQFLFPKVSAYRELDKRIDTLYYDSRFIIQALGWAAIAFVLLLGDYIFPLWLGTETYSASRTFISLYVSFEALILLIIVPFHFINGSNVLRLNTYFELILRSSHLVAMVVGYAMAQVNGLIWGMILSTLLNIPFQYYVFHQRIIGLTSIREAILPVIPPVLLIVSGLSTFPEVKWISFGLFLLSFWAIFYRKSGLHVLRLIKRSE